MGAKTRVDDLPRNQPHDEFAATIGMVAFELLVHWSKEIVQDQSVVLADPFDQSWIGDCSRERIAQRPFVVAVARATSRTFGRNLEHRYGFTATSIARFNSTSRESVGRYPDLTSRTF